MTPGLRVPGIDGPVAVALGAFRPAETAGIHDLVRRFRAGDPDAFAVVLEAAIAAAAGDAALAGERFLLVVVPGHEPGVDGGPGHSLAAALARELEWQVPDPPPLLRTAVVPPAKARDIARDPEVDAASLSWTEPVARSSNAAPPVLLLDDVVGSGATLAACAAAIRRDGPGRRVRALAVARALLDPGS